MRPVHYSMALVGLHFTLDRRKILKSLLFVVYYCVILSTNLYDLLRYFRTYEYGMAFGPTLVMKICSHVFYLSIIMGAIVQFKYSICKGKIMQTWQEYIDKYRVKKGLVIALRRKCIVIACVGWTMISACVISSCYELNRKDSILEALFAYSFPINTPFRIALFVVHHFYSASVLSFSVFHLIALCAGLGQEFNEIHDDLKRKRDPEGGLKVPLEFFRQRHRKLTEVVCQVDDIFSIYNLFSIVVNVGMSCLIMYSLFTVRTDNPEKYASIAGLFLFYMSIFLIIPLSISFAGVYLHQSVSWQLRYQSLLVQMAVCIFIVLTKFNCFYLEYIIMSNSPEYTEQNPTILNMNSLYYSIKVI